MTGELIETDNTLEKNDRLQVFIIDGILAIRKTRVRPSYSTVLSYVNNSEEFNLNIDNLRTIMDEMMENNKIYVKGKKGSESFYVSRESDGNPDINSITGDSDDENFRENIIDDISYDNIVNKVKGELLLHINEQVNLLSTEFEKKFTLLNEHLDLLSMKVNRRNYVNTNDQYSSNYINKAELKDCIDDNLAHYHNSEKDGLVNDGNVYLNSECRNNTIYSNQNTLITTLKDEITFLRNELRSKDKIIELIIKESPTAIRDNNMPFNKDNEFQLYNKTFKRSDMESNKNNLILKNRFSPLTIYNDKDDTIYADDNNNNSDLSGKDYTPVKTIKSTKRKCTVIGDSVIKNIQAYKMQLGMRNTDKVYVKPFSGSTTSDMWHHAKPSQRFFPQMFILHSGSNDLKSLKSAEEIATEVIELGLELKTDDNEVVISGITYRNDKWNDKGHEVNNILSYKCTDSNLGFIDNSNITKQHLNGSGVHLNFQGTVALANNFLRIINA